MGFGDPDAGEGDMGFGEDFGEALPAAGPVETASTSAPAPKEATKDTDVIESVEGGDTIADEAPTGHVSATRSGWLKLTMPQRTLSRRGRNNKEKWVALTDEGLTVGTSAVQVSHTYPFSEIKSFSMDELVPKTFTVATKKKQLHFTAKNEEQAKAWVDSIQMAFKKVSGGFGTRRASATAALLF
eukprot:UC1_evm1s972